MEHEQCVSIDIAEQVDVVRARQAGRELARSIGLGTADQTRFATVISELTRNALVYAGAGRCDLSVERTGGELIIKVVVSDAGPGIADIELAMSPGHSTGNGLGAGLPGVRRLMDHFHLHSQPGGTRVEAAMRRRQRQ